MPDKAIVWNNKAWMQVMAGDFTNALSAVDKALKLKPDDAAAMGTRCFALVGLDRRDEAKVDCARAAASRADDLMDTGMLAFLEGRIAEARRLWTEALSKEPTEHFAVDPYLKK